MTLAEFGRGMVVALVAAFLWAHLPPGAMAHEGHDHDVPPQPASGGLAPRAEAASADFEIVAVPRGGELILYLDRFTDNAPVEGATIELDTPEGTHSAWALGSGIYRVAAPFATAPGRHDFAFTITDGGTTDVLTATLIVPPKEPAGPAASGAATGGATPALAGTGGAGTMLLVAAAAGFLAGVLVMTLRRGRGAAVLVIALALPLLAASFAGAAETQAAMRDMAQRLCSR